MNTPEQAPVSDFTYAFTFKVNECSEFPSMGTSYNDIKTPAEALKVFMDIPEYKRSLIPGIELVRTDNLGNEVIMPLSIGKRINLDDFQYYLAHTTDKDASQLIKSFCFEARDMGFDIKGSCTLYNLDKLSEEQFKPAMAQVYIPSVNRQETAAIGANRRHRS